MSKTPKNIIFDLGAVMVNWNPQAIAKNYTKDSVLQQSIIQGLFQHENWGDFDHGLISEAELIDRSTLNMNLNSIQIKTLMKQAKESLSAKQDIVNLLKLAKDQQLNTYCLSNLSHEWFEYLSHRHDFFNCFDGKIISAQEGIGKPNIKIYQRMIKRYQINCERTLFIDDRSENTLTASSLGIHCVTFNHSADNLKTIKQFIVTP